MIYILLLLLLMSQLSVLYILRKKPIFDPRIIFTFSSFQWLLILDGILFGFQNYLAFTRYKEDVDILIIKSVLIFLLGYISYILGATIGISSSNVIINKSHKENTFSSNLLLLIIVIFSIIALFAFAVNVYKIAKGNLIDFIKIAGAIKYEIVDMSYVSGVFYIFGYIAVNFSMFLLGYRERHIHKMPKYFKYFIFILFLIFLVVKISQARIFQTIAFIGACYFSYLLGKREYKSYLNYINFFIFVILIGVGLYFLRMLSVSIYTNMMFQAPSFTEFIENFKHYSLERGNVANFPVVMKVIDEINFNNLLLGKTLFNWILYLVPKSILPPDYLISLWIKKKWYLEIEGGGLPPTAVGEWYANFGYLGVVIGMLFIGYILGFLYKRTIASSSPFWAVMWANIASGFILIYPKTDLSQVPTFSLIFILFTFTLYKLLYMFFSRQLSSTERIREE